MKHKLKRLTALLLSLTLALSMASVSVLAAEEDDRAPSQSEIMTETTAKEKADPSVKDTEEMIETLQETKTEPEVPAQEPEEEQKGSEDGSVTSEEPIDTSKLGTLAEEVVVTAKSVVASGTCGDNLTWTLDDTGTLTISGNGKMDNYGHGYAPWSNDSEKITSVVIESGVTSIGSYAFLDCSSLTSVTISDNVTSINDGAFSDCSSLTSVAIPDSVTSIGDYAFVWCENLTSVIIPNGITSIGDSTFASCTSLTTVEIPDSVTSIGEDAFANTRLTSVKIPGSVKSIDLQAFCECSYLTDVTISEGVEVIGYNAFADCSNLKNITIPKSVVEIGKYAFGYIFGDEKHGDDSITVLDGFAIYGYTGTCAETYADENDITFMALDQEFITILSILPDVTDKTYKLGSNTGMSIHCTGELADFLSVSMDSETVDKSNYDLQEGSTILTFTSDYMDTLSVGEHTVTLYYKTGKVSTTLAVLESVKDTVPDKSTVDSNAAMKDTSSSDVKNTSSTSYGTKTTSGVSSSNKTSEKLRSTTDSPVKTGDEAHIALWVALLIMSGVVIAVFACKRKI